MPDRFTLLITGPRTWVNRALLYRELNAVLDAHPCLLLVHGACPEGADQMADDWRTAVWRAGGDVMVQRFPAIWRKNGRKNPLAGFDRNQVMVDLTAAAGPDGTCRAFTLPCEDPRCRRPEPHITHGTADCLERARRAGIDVKEVPGG